MVQFLKTESEKILSFPHAPNYSEHKPTDSGQQHLIEPRDEGL